MTNRITESLDPVDPEYDLAQSELLQGLSQVAKARPKPKPRLLPPSKSRRSRFFYSLPPTEDDLIAERKRLVSKKPEHDQDIESYIREMAKAYKGTLPAQLEKSIDEVRQFFLNEINPLILGSLYGRAQAQSILVQALGQEVDVSTPNSKFERVMSRAIDTKMVNFMSTFFGVSRKELLEAMQTETPPREVLFLDSPKNPQPPGKRSGGRQPVSNAHGRAHGTQRNTSS